MNGEITFHLEDFDGPLELLLALVSKHKMDLHNIPILTLIDQYTQTVDAARQAGPEVASAFIEMAARLVEMKSFLLLPRSEEGERMKEELTGQLVEYDQCRRLAENLRQRAEQTALFVRQPLYRRPGPCQLCRNGAGPRPDTAGRILCPRSLLHPVKGRQVMPAALHGPDLVPLGTEGLLGIALHPHIDQERPAIFIHRDAAGIVVVMAVPIGAHLCPQDPCPLPGGIDPHTGVPHRRHLRRTCSIRLHLLLCKGGEQPVPQVDLAAAVLVLQPVRVGVCPQILCRQCAQSRAVHSLSKPELPCSAAPS